ncbi:hypothetical protein ACLB2K_024186 [Fragaria x ananassa]
MFLTTIVVSFLGFLAWAYQNIQSPRPKICGSPDGPPVTAPRVKLRDGRHLAYQEHGVPKQNAQNKIVFVHGFGGCRHDAAIAVETLTPKTAEDLGGVYMVSFDRPGCLPVWGCLKYILGRLAGAALLAPVVNYWWKGFPAKLCNHAYYYQQFQRDQWALRVSHYTPWLTSFWNTQKWFPASSVLARSLDVLSPQDKEILLKPPPKKIPYNLDLPSQQGEAESVHRDLKVGFGTWEFSPLDLENPFPNNEASVHLWHGDEDLMVPVTLQRYIAQQLPWIHYHEIPGAGHFFPQAYGKSDAIFTALLTHKK